MSKPQRIDGPTDLPLEVRDGREVDQRDVLRGVVGEHVPRSADQARPARPAAHEGFEEALERVQTGGALDVGVDLAPAVVVDGQPPEVVIVGDPELGQALVPHQHQKAALRQPFRSLGIERRPGSGEREFAIERQPPSGRNGHPLERLRRQALDRIAVDARNRRHWRS
jgi:hypothetical protein